MRLCILLLVVPFARLVALQESDSARRAPGATVTGVVRDSVARMPLAGAVVQLVAADSLTRFARTAIADAQGRFTIGDVPEGRYSLGFFHPMLDSLGLSAPLREVRVSGRAPVRADLGLPSPARLRAAICGPQSADAGAVVVGFVRDARDRAPAAGATVHGEWLELSFTPDGIIRRTPRLEVTTGTNGWFALCNVPGAGTLALVASRGADSTDRIDVQVPGERFLRRELYLGPSRAVVTGDTVSPGDTLAPPPRVLRVGDGRLSGTVVSAAEGRLVAGAQVGIANGSQTRANERGEWALEGAPLGTRMLEVRAVGYYPERRPVNVLAGAEPVRVALSTLKAVLDTVRITASRVNDRLLGFEMRRRSGMGRYVTATDVARRQPLVTSDLFGMMPGLYVERVVLGQAQLSMRGLFGSRCSPAVYINGQYMSIIGADDIDSWVHPDEVAGIEVYSATMVPAEYQLGMTGCGSIVIWTRPSPRSSKPLPFAQRLFGLLGAVALGVLVGVVLVRY